MLAERIAQTSTAATWAASSAANAIFRSKNCVQSRRRSDAMLGVSHVDYLCGIATEQGLASLIKQQRARVESRLKLRMECSTAHGASRRQERKIKLDKIAAMILETYSITSSDVSTFLRSPLNKPQGLDLSWDTV
jgi:hypothetical protein